MSKMSLLESKNKYKNTNKRWKKSKLIKRNKRK